MSDNDDFWNIALSEPLQEFGNKKQQQEEEENDESSSSSFDVSQSKAKLYRLPTTDITLKLQSLPSANGVWSPLGADAWYASAVLASLLLSRRDLCGGSNKKKSANNNNCVILELGSGAVGLSGLACAVALARSNTCKKGTVILTDNDPLVLNTLRANVEHNMERICSLSGNDGNNINNNNNNNNNIEILVRNLDWNDGYGDDTASSSSSSTTTTTTVDLVIGSELVYTVETANALCNLLEEMLLESPSIKIWIVQVTDRFGWMDIVVPRLESLQGVTVQSYAISSDIHDLACTMIPMGGTLDRHAYGAFCISKK